MSYLSLPFGSAIPEAPPLPAFSSLSSLRSSALPGRHHVITSVIPWAIIFLKFILFIIIYFWLHWVFVAARAFSSCSERGLLFVAVHGLLIAVASLVAEHGL